MTAASSSSPSSGFFSICMLHAAAAAISGTLMIFWLQEAAVVGHGAATAALLVQGSTPHDQLLIQTSDSFAGLLLVTIGLLLFMVAFVEDRQFQVFFAKGCVLLHIAFALWRLCFERRVEALAADWPRQLVGDLVLGLSWLLFLSYSWNQMYG